MLIIQSCPILWDPMDHSLPGSSVHGIFQARILKWVAIPFSRGFSQPKWGIKLGSPTLEADSLPSEPLCLSFLNPWGWSLELWDLDYLVLAVGLESTVIWQTMTEVKLKIKTQHRIHPWEGVKTEGEGRQWAFLCSPQPWREELW